jgi:hypothetical protein
LSSQNTTSPDRHGPGRPISVTVLAWLFIAVGAVAFVRNFPAALPLEKDAFLIEFVELVGLTAGIFMLRGQNWARWLALAWAAFHVAVAAFLQIQGLLFHVAIFVGIACLLLRSDASQYFHRARSGSA